jgi:putative ABC transport system substrate-binding protein
MGRREFTTLVASLAFWPLAARAQQAERVRRIGVLMGVAEDRPEANARLAGFRRGLEKHGWFEGRNVRIDYRFAPGGTQAQVLAKELIALKPDVILANSTPVAAALQLETRTIPIVFAGLADPIGSGFVASFAKPGGNMTGPTLFEASVTGKWLAMLKEIAPNLVRAAFLKTPSSVPYFEYYMHAALELSSSLGIEPVTCVVEHESEADIERAIESFAMVPNGGLVVMPDTTPINYSDLIIGLVARHRLPAVYFLSSFVTAGGLMSYGADFVEVFRQSASYVDRILRGDSPTDLPVQAVTRFETTINLRTAKALGLTVPSGLLVAADEVIE